MPRRAPLLLTLLVLGLVLGGAASASSHASLVGTDPADGSTLPRLPSEVTFEFNEPIGPSSNDVAVTAPDGSAVTISDVVADGREVTARIEDSRATGEHVVAYRVVSADGHPVSGQIQLTIADASQEAVAASPEPVSQDFVHRHSEHLLLGGLIAAVAMALIVVPLLRRSRS